MNVATLSTFLIAVSAVGSSIGVPLYLQSRREKRDQRAIDVEDARRLAEGSEVSWEKINLVLVQERNRLQDMLDRQAERHAAELLAMKERHQHEIDVLTDRLADCQAQVTTLQARPDEQ